MVADERSRWHSVLQRQEESWQEESRQEESRQAELAQFALEKQQRQEQQQAREAEIARRNREAELEVLRMASEAEQSTVAGAVTLPEPSPSLPGPIPALSEATSPPMPSVASDLIIEAAGVQQQIPSGAQEDSLPPEIVPPQLVEPVPMATPSGFIAATSPATPEPELSPPQAVASDSTLTLPQHAKTARAEDPAKAPVRAPEFAPPDIGMMEVPIEVPVAPPSSVSPPVTTRHEIRRAPVPRSIKVPRRRQRRSRTLSRRAREWRIAVVAASLFTVVLIGAWSLATSPRPAAPLSLRQLQQSSRIQQDLPFGPVRITNPPTARTAQPPVRANSPLAAPNGRQSSSSAQTQPKPKPSAYRSSRKAAPARDNPNANEDEVVVRHILPARHSSAQAVARHNLTAPNGQQPEPAQAKAGLRHISDLD
jgi:hypothetical protein